MLKLLPGIHGLLNHHVIASLEQKGIKTISELLQMDSIKLKQLLKIGKIILKLNGCKIYLSWFWISYLFSLFEYCSTELSDVHELKNDLWKYVGILPINGYQHHEILMTQSGFISTGIKRYSIFFVMKTTNWTKVFF